MPGGEDESQAVPFFPGRSKGLEEPFLLALSGAPGDDDLLPAIHPEAAPEGLQFVRREIGKMDLGLEIARDLKSPGLDPQLLQLFLVLPGLDQEQVHVPEDLPRERAQVAIFFKRSLGDPAVDEEDLLALPLDLPEEVRPELGLRQDENIRPESFEDPSHGAPEIEGDEEYRVRFLELLPGDADARVGEG